MTAHPHRDRHLEAAPAGTAAFPAVRPDPWWRRPRPLLLAAILAVVVLWLLLGQLLERSARTLQTYPATVTRVEVAAGAGEVTIIAPSVDEISVERVERFSLRGPTPTATIDETTLALSDGCPSLELVFGSCTVDYRITVPPSVLVRVATSSGAIEVEGITGDVRLETDSGDITARRLGSVNAEALTTSGELRLGFVRPPDRVRAESGTGDIDIEVPDLSYRVDADTVVGELTLDLVADPDAPRVIEAQSTDGDVTISRRR